MADLTSGRYPQRYEPYALNGSAVFRENFDRRYPLASAGVTATADTAYVVPVVFQQGDRITAITIGVKTATSSTPSHGWAALYSGLTTASTLLAQSADDTSGFHGSGSAQTFTLATAYQVGASPGSTGTDGPIVLGVCIYNNGGAGGVVDGYLSSQAVAGNVFQSGQVPLIFTKASTSAGATAPSTLSGFAAATAGSGIPYVSVTVAGVTGG